MSKSLIPSIKLNFYGNISVGAIKFKSRGYKSLSQMLTRGSNQENLISAHAKTILTEFHQMMLALHQTNWMSIEERQILPGY